MELKLEVILSSSIKRKKPWPRFCWLGQEKESVFLLDDKRISEINMVSGRTKKKTPKLHHLLNNVVTMASSHNGMWLCGLLVSGELFLWSKDKDLLKTAVAVPEVAQIIASAQENSIKLSLQVSCDGMHVLLAAITGQVFLWECADVRDFTGLRDGPVKGHWAHIQPLEETLLPSLQDKEASQQTIFVKTEVMGDVCLSAFVFTSGKQLIITVLKIQRKEGHVKMGSAGYNIQWATKTYPMSHLTPPCHPVKSRGALVPAFSPDGRLLAIVLNQRQPQATQVLFVSTQNTITISSTLGGCGSKKMDIPSKYIRSYWVSSVSWSPGGLFLACVLKRGSLLMVARLGGLLTLTSSGCNVDFGPAQFLPLHPLVTYRAPVSAGKGEASLSSSSISVRDILRQRYSVTWHPRLLYLIVSDGYMATVMRVLDKPSPALFLKTLLKEVSKDLEKASCKLDKSQVHVKAWLESISCLNLDSSLDEFNPAVSYRPKTSDSVISAGTDASRLPLFLQEQQTLGGTKELLESMQAFFEDESDLEGVPAGSHMEEGGRLEFASMFDTLHALETYNDSAFPAGPIHNKNFVESEKKIPLQRELGRIQSKLLTAWAFGMSMGNAIEHRVSLMKHTLCCVVRFAALLHLLPSSMVHTGKKNHPTFACLLHLIKSLLSFLSWDSTSSDGPHCLGLLVEFSKWIVHLLLTPHPDSYQTGHCLVSSQSLSRIMNILQLVTDSLDRAYSLQQRTYWSSGEEVTPAKPQVWPSDVYHIHLLQNENTEKSSSTHRALPVPHRPSSRLLGVWQLVYNVTQQYAEELKRLKGCDGWEEEEERLSVIMSQIQTALQTTGQNLEEGPSLLSYSGERLFLCGLYPKSADAWRLQICQEASKSSERSVFLEMRLCLALLYSLLSQYHLKEAQEFGDHMAQLILLRAGNQIDSLTSITDPLPCPWLPMNLHSDVASAVVQTLGRFMASYFTNQPLFILPAHNVDVLPLLHLPDTPSAGRLLPLCQEDVAKAVRQQHLSEVWTVDYALDLLLLGGLLPEAVWLAYHLGDWKTAVTLSLAYSSYCTERYDFTQLRRRELHLPTVLQPETMFQAELGSLLGNKTDSQECADRDEDKSLTSPLEGEDWDMLWASVQEILKASVMAGVNVLLSPLSSLLEKAKNMTSSLPALVPIGLYLPSPPLYCPQPSPNTQDQMGTMGHFAEVSCRHKVSGFLQRLLLLLRCARCCHPAAQWYISRLRHARHILHKIKKKYSYPSADQEEKAFPEGLMKLITRGGYFRRGPNKDGRLDSDIIHTIICFRELCALCWVLHVRDQLSLHCRRYQAARQHRRDEEISDDSEVNSACVDALRWACRFLPFSHFLGAEEVLQDILLSLVSELPPVTMVAETLVQAFPQEEESVRVPLREKYNLLLKRLKQCNVLDAEKKEANKSMMSLIRDKNKYRRKHLARLQRHLAPPVLHLWEKEETEENKGSNYNTAMMGQLSLGTSLTTSTVTDGDVDAAANTSVAVSPEQHLRAKTRSKKPKKEGKDAENVIQEKGDKTKDGEKDQPSLPVIGTWEFELEDKEYLNFLELFLSYLLEKNNTDGEDLGSELPLLRGFCSELRERELNSLKFDVLSTIHRRQKVEHHPVRKHLSSSAPPVFRAGSCYKPVKQGEKPELQTSLVCSEAPTSRANLSISSHPGLRTGKQKGLFGLRQQSGVPSASVKEAVLGSETSPNKNACSTRQRSESFIFGSPVSLEAVTDLQQGLTPELEAKFPELGRLLEWMVRWADRKVLLGHHGKKKNVKEGETDEGVVIRVKASSPAILTSLSLLEYKYTALPQTERYSSHIQVPEMQWAVAPVLQPEGDRKLDRESSIDTGYPGSANTPTIGLDHNLQHGELASYTDEPEKLTFQRMPLPADQLQLSLDPQQGRASPEKQMSFDDLDVTPEKEDRSGDSKSLDVLSSGSNEDTSRNICTPEMSLKLEDLDYSERAEEMSSSTSNCPPELPEAPAPPSTQPKTTPCAEPTDSSRVHFPNPAVDPPNRQPQNSTAAADSASCNQPSVTSPIRQRLGEDLFRLVQHINYMSLSEVLGASFSSFHQAQQRFSVAPPGGIPSQPNRPSSSSTKIMPEPNVSPIQTTIAAAPQTQSNPVASCEFVNWSATKISPGANQNHADRNLLSSASGVGVSYQQMQPLSVQAQSPDIQHREENLIPFSQGLLATTDTCPAIQNPPVLLPSAENDSSSQVLGLKLLKLHPSVIFQHSAPHCPQTLHAANHETFESCQAKDKHKDQATRKKKSGEQRNGSKHLSFNPPHNPTPRSPQPQMWPSEQSVGQVFSLLRPAFPTFTPAPTQGLRLLQLQHVPQSNVTFPKLSLPFVSRPAVVSAPVTGAPMIKLLHIESEPKMMMPRTVPPTRMTRLISMEELTRSEIGRRDAEDAQLQLLRVNLSTRRPSSPSRCTPSKRQKRREEKAKSRKTEVTFHLNESIIPTQEAADASASEEPAVTEGIAPTRDMTGSSDCLLTGQRLLDKVFSTSAELHAFASTSKRPPESHDAFTNTDPACSPVLVDKAVSVRASVTIGGSTCPVRSTEETPQKPEEILDMGGHQFISVVDLEEIIQHEDLLQHPSREDVPSSPTSAQLHVLATSVIRAAAEPQSSVPVEENTTKPTSSTDVPAASPSFSHNSRVSERLTLQNNVMVDLSDSEICRTIKAQSVVRTHSSPPTVQFSSRLSELDAQLAALQNIADNLEMDFSSSRLLVNKIEKLSSDMAPDVKTTTPVKKTVRISVPTKAWTPRSDSDRLTKLKTREKTEEEHDEEHVHRDSIHPGTKPSLHDSTSPSSQRAGPSSPYSPPAMKDHFSETYRISHAWADENLSQTGLSDTAEILDELVREGYLSPTDWSLSTSQTAHRSRQDQQQSSWTVQKPAVPEDERKELRIWMRRKQRERLSAYQKHRENLREREHKPFSSHPTGQSQKKNRAATGRSRAEKEKFTLMKQYNQRTREACSLAADFLTSPEDLQWSSQTHAPPVVSNTPLISAPPGSAHRPHTVSVSDKRRLRSQSGQAPCPQSVERRQSEDLRRKLGLHRPVTYLPGDRLSRVTRRGMLSNTKSQTKHPTASQSERGLGSTFSHGAASGRGIPRQQTRVEETEEVDRSESKRLQGLDEFDIVLSEQDDAATGGASEMDWMDNLSESAGSSLSKIDWAAIERIVAEEDD
ncbi:ciliogenesis and planar polarity effector 1 isoform X3 [Kryptolebias marmoratus]|uniref:ciliogenesis and planar polarity effector 1 isoform X3 n=1 Tax=Kryptolebias marmoratus TaxID=37003 RepID=UPI0007F9229B|nr:ciliogenesis and planar polarity effector 1 isoform X3 [Kryptolebias marmoratus]